MGWLIKTKSVAVSYHIVINFDYSRVCPLKVLKMHAFLSCSCKEGVSGQLSCELANFTSYLLVIHLYVIVTYILEFKAWLL